MAKKTKDKKGITEIIIEKQKKESGEICESDHQMSISNGSEEWRTRLNSGHGFYAWYY